MKTTTLLFLAVCLFWVACTAEKKEENKNYPSDSLIIKPLSENVFVHTTYLAIPGYGNFPCNGLIVKDQGEAVIFDTPSTDSVSVELIEWVEKELDCKIKAVVATHFHDDCLGGLNAFHERNIESYANNPTITFAGQEGNPIPQKGFDGVLEIMVGSKKIVNTFFGEGHTKDNVVTYVPGEQVLFGGCLIKEMNAGKGNLNDANTADWPVTVQKVKEAYPEIQYVVPGHGEVGGPELFDYTIKLFQ
ncbi:subclass B1 metallo-beta-lactamase [Rapidithrix thailandica]|uniref:beta-lactamase n=1 Tax=Rapidithrix thailandica TaxID=413964 RepID=A0AAW9RRN3_9BACT